MLKKTSLLLSAVLTVSLSGCSALYQYQHEVRDTDLVDVSYDAVETLQDKLPRPLLKNSLIIVSTLVNINNQNQTSSFGRLISNQVGSALHDAGYQIIAMELPTDLFVVEEEGQLHLSPETRQMLKRYNASTIVGGVYAPGKKNTYVSLRMIDLSSRSYVSSADFSVPMGPDAKQLLKPKNVGEEVPVTNATAVSPAEPMPATTSPELSAPEADKATVIPQ